MFSKQPISHVSSLSVTASTSMIILRNHYCPRLRTTFTLLSALHGTPRPHDKVLQKTRTQAPGKNARMRLHVEVCAGAQLAKLI